MGSMDICLPNFAESGYYHAQASSTFAMALECNVSDCLPVLTSGRLSSIPPQVPILVTERMKASYTYAADDRAVITRPAAMREVAALRALRTSDASEFLSGVPLSSPMRKAVEEMMVLGWLRPRVHFQAFKDGIWKQNEIVVMRLLRDL